VSETAVQLLRARLPEMVRLLEELVMSESPSSDGEALTATAQLLAYRGSVLLGCNPEWLGAGSPVLRWELPAQGASTGPPVLLLGHLDTVWPSGTTERWPFAVEGARATGPGIFDMKAGLVQALFAMAESARRGDPSPGVVLLVTSDEEIGSPGGRAHIEREAAISSAVFVLEASADGRLKVARKGVGIYRLTVTGRAAHAGLEPERGVNALAIAAELVRGLPAIADPDVGTTVTPTLATAGTAQNTVPALAEVTLDVRASTVAEQERIDRALRALAVPDGASLGVAGGVNRPPLEAGAAEALFTTARGLAASCGITVLEGAAVGGASDGNFTAALGIPTLDGLGAVGGGAHAEGEHVVLADMPTRAALVAGLITAAARSEQGAVAPGEAKL